MRSSRRSRPPRRKFAERVVKWDFDNNVRREMAYNHYFAKPAPKRG